MLGLASGAILVPLNSTMLAVALPSVMAEFAVAPAAVASLVTLYLGAVAIALPVSGSLGDRFGHRRVFLFGVGGFALASADRGAGPRVRRPRVARVLQAASGALVSTSSVALASGDGSPPDRRGAAFGLFDMLVSTSAAVGPLVGGLLVGAFGWRSLFLLAVPSPSWRSSRAIRPDPMVRRRGRASRRAPPPIDVPGPRPAPRAPDRRSCSPCAAADGATTARGARRAGASRRCSCARAATEHPAVDPRLFAARPFAAALVGVLRRPSSSMPTLVLVPLLVEVLQGGSPRPPAWCCSGSALARIAAPFGGRLSDRDRPARARGPRRGGHGGRPRRSCGSRADASPLRLAGCSASSGPGWGWRARPARRPRSRLIAPDRVGMAAGTYYTGRYLGGVIGASLAGAVLGGRHRRRRLVRFGILTRVAVGIVVASAALPGRRR